MATRRMVGGPFNNMIIASLMLVDRNGEAYDLLGSLAGDIAIVPAKRAGVPVPVRDRSIATVPGQYSAGSITIPLHARALLDVESAGYSTLYQALAQTGTGTAFEPILSAAMSDFDGDTAGDVYAFDESAKAFKVELVLKRKTTAIGELVTIYAEWSTPDIGVANAGAISAVSLNGVIPRAGCIALETT